MSQPTRQLSRRVLFLGAGTAGAAATLATLAPTTPSVAPQVEAPKPPPERGGGYSLSAHVKQYYKTTMV